MAQGLVKQLSRGALDSAIEQIKEEAELIATHPCGVFPFKDSEESSGMPAVDVHVDESVIALGWKVAHQRVFPPKDTMILHLCSFLKEAMYYFLFKSGYEEESPEHIILFSGDVCRVIDYDEIDVGHAAMIAKRLNEWAFHSIKNFLETRGHEES